MQRFCEWFGVEVYKMSTTLKQPIYTKLVSVWKKGIRTHCLSVTDTSTTTEGFELQRLSSVQCQYNIWYKCALLNKYIYLFCFVRFNNFNFRSEVFYSGTSLYMSWWTSLANNIPSNVPQLVWYSKCCGVYYPVCGIVHIKRPLLLLGKNSLSSGFLIIWVVVNHMVPHNHKLKWWVHQ